MPYNIRSMLDYHRTTATPPPSPCMSVLTDLDCYILMVSHITLNHHNVLSSIQFGIVFTAEPDSTKMFMYKWDDRKINGTGVLTYVGNVSCIEKCELCVFVYV